MLGLSELTTQSVEMILTFDSNNYNKQLNTLCIYCVVINDQ